MILGPFFTSTAVVAIGEIGDKTQLLAIVLAAKFRKPVPIILGVLCATLLNHLAAATLGYYVSAWLGGQAFKVIVGVAFIAMAAWALIPDKMDDELKTIGRGGVFLTTDGASFVEGRRASCRWRPCRRLKPTARPGRTGHFGIYCQ